MMLSKALPKCLVIFGYGINCEEETLFAFKLAKIESDLIHINDLISCPSLVEKYQIIAFPGGFSYADKTGAGNALASKISCIADCIEKFVQKDKLIIGICNGAQVLTRLFSQLGVVFESNDSCQYQCEWVDIEVVDQSCPWLKDMQKIRLPIAHAEGKLLAKKGEQNFCKALTYIKNPNGSLQNLAAINAFNGKMLITMPHPERAIFAHQTDSFYKKRELARRSGTQMEEYGPGLKIFQNAYRYFI